MSLVLTHFLRQLAVLSLVVAIRRRQLTPTTPTYVEGLYRFADEQPSRLCPITLDPLTARYMECDQCHHCFSEAPLQQWFASGKHTCPYCRDPGHGSWCTDVSTFRACPTPVAAGTPSFIDARVASPPFDAKVVTSEHVGLPDDLIIEFPPCSR